VISGTGSAETFIEHTGTIHVTGHLAVGGVFGGDGRDGCFTKVIIDNGGSISASELYKLNALEVTGAGSRFTADVGTLGYAQAPYIIQRFGATTLTASAGGLINISRLVGSQGGGLTVDSMSEINIGTTSGTRG